jgi:hypothetical protein
VYACRSYSKGATQFGCNWLLPRLKSAAQTNDNSNTFLHSALNPVDSEQSQSTQHQITEFDTSKVVDQGLVPAVHYERDAPPNDQMMMEVLTRPYPLPKPIEWNSKQNEGFIIYNFDPLRFLLSRDNIHDKIAGFQNMRASVRIRFQVTGNAFFSGKLVAYWVPLNRIGDYSSDRMTQTTISGIQQRVEMYPIDSTTYELVISPLLPKRYWTTESINFKWPQVWPPQSPNVTLDPQVVRVDSPETNFVSCGIVSLMVFAPFQAQDPADHATIKIYCNFEKLEFDNAYTGHAPTWTAPDDWENPVYPGAITYVPSSPIWYMSGFRRKLQNGVQPTPNADDQPLPDAEAIAKEKRGTWSLATKKLSDMMRVFTPLTGVYAPLVAAASVTTSGISQVLEYFNFDKPRENALPVRYLPAYKNFSYGNGVDQAQMLSTDATNAVVPVGLHQPFDAAALQISTLCAQEQLIYSMDVDSSLAEGTTLWNWAVAPWNAPVYAYNYLDGDKSASQLMEGHTYWSWLARLFQYWRGECEITLEVVAPAFAKMYLQLTWVPGNAEDPTSQALSIAKRDVPNNSVPEMLTKIVRVSGVTKVRFRIPYRAADYALNSDVNKTPYNYAGAGIANENFSSTNGAVFLSIVQPLTQYSPAGIKASPVRVLISASFPGIQFFRPSVHQLESAPCGYFEAASPSAPDSAPKFNADDDVVTGPMTMGLSHTHFFGECIDDVLTLAKRPHCIFATGNFDQRFRGAVFSLFYAPVAFEKHLPLDQNILAGSPIPNKLDLYPSAVAAWLARMFLTWRGEVTYTVVPQTYATFEGPVPTYQATLTNVDMMQCAFSPFGTSLRSEYTPYQLFGGNPSTQVSMGTGCSIRPAHVDGVPPTAVVPYYSAETFHLTPDFRANDTIIAPFRSYTLYNNNKCPGISVSIVSGATDTSPLPLGIYANVGDNFSFGGLYPPCMSTVTLSYTQPDIVGYLADLSTWPSGS